LLLQSTTGEHAVHVAHPGHPRATTAEAIHRSPFPLAQAPQQLAEAPLPPAATTRRATAATLVKSDTEVADTMPADAPQTVQGNSMSNDDRSELADSGDMSSDTAASSLPGQVPSSQGWSYAPGNRSYPPGQSSIRPSDDDDAGPWNRRNRSPSEQRF
jgi:hypothetical protein